MWLVAIFLLLTVCYPIGICGVCEDYLKSVVQCDAFEDIPSVRNKSIVYRLIVKMQETPLPCTQPILSDFTDLHYFENRNGFLPLIEPMCFSRLPKLVTLNLNNNKVVTIDFAAFNGMEFKTLLLNRNHFRRAFFERIIMPRLEELDLSRNLLERFEIRTTNAPELWKLSLNGNKLVLIKIESRTVREIYLQDNYVKTFNSEDLNAPNLRRLHLNNNHLKVLTYEAFQNCPKLVYLHLEDNHLISIEIPSPNKLQDLDLRNNKIRTMDAVRFEELNERPIIDLSLNRLYELELQSDIRPNNNILAFFCYRCKIHIVYPDFLQSFMPNLTSLILTENLIDSMDMFHTSTHFPLTNLDLKYNFIALIGKKDLAMVPLLKAIDLRFNKIKSIHRNAFKAQMDLKSLHLDFNCILSLPDNFVETISSVIHVGLDENLITYFPIPERNAVCFFTITFQICSG